jgi:prevent-host-death family protein
LLAKAQREPVTISKHGRAGAVVMSATAFEDHQRFKLELLRQEVRRGLGEAEQGVVISAEQAFADLDKEL